MTTDEEIFRIHLSWNIGCKIIYEWQRCQSATSIFE